MRTHPFAWSIRFHNWIRYRHIEDKKRLIRIKKSIEAYIYIYENEFFIPNAFYFEKTIDNKEYISALKWELQGLENTIHKLNERIKFFYEWYKPTT